MPASCGAVHMPDPLTAGAVGAVVARAARSAGSSNAAETGRLLTRMLGPAADAFGQALARSVEYRTRNFGRIADRAARKASADISRGIVNARVVYTLLDEGSLCDDELMAEYLGGLLAGSRSPDGRDDRAVTWCKVITGMSALQVKAHYILYREWAGRLHGIDDLNIGIDADRMSAMMNIDLNEFVSTLNDGFNLEENAALSHVIAGLNNAGLLGEGYSFGPRSVVSGASRFESVLSVHPSVLGVELYGWAQGLTGLLPGEFPSKAEVFSTEPQIPRLTGVDLPNLEGREAARLPYRVEFPPAQP